MVSHRSRLQCFPEKFENEKFIPSVTNRYLFTSLALRGPFLYKGHCPLCGEGSVILSRLKLSKMLQTSLVFVLFQLSVFTQCFRYRALAVRKLDLVNQFLSFVRFVFVLCHSFSNGYGVAVSQGARIVKLCQACKIRLSPASLLCPLNTKFVLRGHSNEVGNPIGSQDKQNFLLSLTTGSANTSLNSLVIFS